MASERHAHRALAAGLSVGACLAIPAAAFAATIPFDDVHGVVATAALPFAAGSLVGVGLLSLSAHVVREHGEDIDHAAERAEVNRQNRAAAVRASRQAGVPQISRAVDAMSEEEAWADIDSLLDANNGVSCDPLYSKDIYEIALEEMARGSQAEDTGFIRPAATPDTTDVFVSLASMGNAASATTVAPADFSAAATGSIPAQPILDLDDLDEPDDAVEQEVPMADYSGHEDMWAAALAILDEDDVPATFAVTAAEPEPEVAVEDDPFVWTPSAAEIAIAAFDAGDTTVISPERISAVAEGAHSTQMHTRVNEILVEELDGIPSESVRTHTREYLRVIQGGTMAMPRQSMEA